MHTATFYSFKGGSGRSMALVNVAAELAKSGQRVLVVDFDLEAPGLDTFKLPRPSVQSDGLVDFVLEYLDTGESPNCLDFIYKSEVPDISGELWVMPAGRNDEHYDGKFKSINWRDLYESQDGYLLFEDLKGQWKDRLNPDYVLIDSRTGHTDVSGICTRQLPDSVFLFIFPTEQNRRGLEAVVHKIRRESEGKNTKEIKLHLVFANVPDLDDEESYIADSIGKVQDSLKFASPSAIIHHYASPFLLTQPIFTLERPRTKLAQEYQHLTKVVRRDNLKDRTVALEFIDRIYLRPSSKTLGAEELDKRLVAIEKEHKSDTEVLTKLALLYQRLRKTDTALKLLEEVEEHLGAGSEFFLTRASLFLLRGKADLALSDFKSVLNTEDATYIEVSAVTRALLFNFPEYVGDLIASPAFNRLADENKYWLTNELLQKREGVDVAYNILSKMYTNAGPSSPLWLAINIQFVLTCIASRKFTEASEIILHDGIADDQLGLEHTFNYAMVRWGLDGKPSPQLFSRTIDLSAASGNSSANMHQCVALVFWILGDEARAFDRLDKSLSIIQEQSHPEFSCWTYLNLSREEFIRDLNEMKALFRGEDILPRFIRGD